MIASEAKFAKKREVVIIIPSVTFFTAYTPITIPSNRHMKNSMPDFNGIYLVANIKASKKHMTKLPIAAFLCVRKANAKPNKKELIMAPPLDALRKTVANKRPITAPVRKPVIFMMYCRYLNPVNNPNMQISKVMKAKAKL